MNSFCKNVTAGSLPTDSVCGQHAGLGSEAPGHDNCRPFLLCSPAMFVYSSLCVPPLPGTMGANVASLPPTIRSHHWHTVNIMALFISTHQWMCKRQEILQQVWLWIIPHHRSTKSSSQRYSKRKKSYKSQETVISTQFLPQAKHCSVILVHVKW